MRALSAAVIVLAGAVLAAAATSPGMPDRASEHFGFAGALVGGVGLLGWAVAYFRDGGRS